MLFACAHERSSFSCLAFETLRGVLMDVFARFNVVAFDLVELAPALDASGRSTALACKLLRECLLALET